MSRASGLLLKLNLINEDDITPEMEWRLGISKPTDDRYHVKTNLSLVSKEDDDIKYGRSNKVQYPKNTKPRSNIPPKKKDSRSLTLLKRIFGG